MQILASALYRCDTFWRFAEDIREAGGDLDLTRQIARRYVPRRGDHGEQEVIQALLLVAAESVGDRYDGQGRPGMALRRLMEVGGAVAWFTDDHLAAGRLYGLPESGRRNRMPGLAGRRVSVAGIAGLERGAEVVRRRGAALCLSPGCDVELELREKVESGPVSSTRRIYFCDRHTVQADRSLPFDEQERIENRPLYEALDAARATLMAAGYCYLAAPETYVPGRVQWSQARPQIAEIERGTWSVVSEIVEPARSPSIVSRIRSGDGDIAEAVSRSIERGFFAEAA